jgi:hypothetical protein
MHKFIYIKSKSIVQNTVDYSGQEMFLEIIPMRGPSRPFQRTVRDTKVCLRQELCKTHIYTADCSKEKRAPSGTKLGPSGLKRGPSTR